MVTFDGARGNRSRVIAVANQLGVPVKTAEQIIKAYCKDLEDSLLNGVAISVPGIFSIKAYPNGVFRGRVSAALSAKAAEQNVAGYKVTEGEIAYDGQDA